MKSKVQIDLSSDRNDGMVGESLNGQGRSMSFFSRCDLHQFADGEFDLAFSNSVIEHLFTLDKQQKMAREAMFLPDAAKLFLQTRTPIINYI